MAKKTKKQKTRATQRARAPARAQAPTAQARGDEPDAVVADASGGTKLGSAATSAPATATTRRRVERVTPGAAAPAPRGQKRGRFLGSSAALVAPMDSDDPAIPYDRVPYVPADLRRVLVIALLMIVLIIIADLVVSNVVK